VKLLFASRYVDPQPKGYNANVVRQARYIVEKAREIDLEILNWPRGDEWGGPFPDTLCEPKPTRMERDGLTYALVRCPDAWDTGISVLDESHWSQAVDYGRRVLAYLGPDLLHLHHRHGFWWLLESAQSLGIPTIYTAHDWGIGCMRTVLVKGDGSLCDGVVEPIKCAKCVKSGRGFIGRLNEELVAHPVGETVLKVADAALLGGVLRRHGAVFRGALDRAEAHYGRASQLIGNLRHCFTPSQFGARFFAALGCPPPNITVLPWYYDGPRPASARIRNGPFTITYIGRVSPEKGVDILFSALEALTDCEPVLLKIAGADDSDYCLSLRQKYERHIGVHAVEWLGWSAVEPLFEATDVTAIPSRWMDNTPLTLLEAMAHKTPVVATRILPIAELVVEGETGFLADFDNPRSFRDAIRRAMERKNEIRSQQTSFPKILTLESYMSRIISVYQDIARAPRSPRQ
jgi:glycosyltransferase involved in cell wall biosynthesis